MFCRFFQVRNFFLCDNFKKGKQTYEGITKQPKNTYNGYLGVPRGREILQKALKKFLSDRSLTYFESIHFKAAMQVK